MPKALRGERTKSNQAHQPSQLPTTLLSNSDVSGIKLTQLEANKLAEQAGQGNQEAGGKLYDAYVEDIHYYFYRRTENRHDAEDLTTETFLRAVKGLIDGTWSGHPFPAWLFAIAKYVFFEWRRKQTNTDIYYLDIQIEEITDEELMEEILTRERCTIIWGAVEQLPEAFNSILKLRYRDNLSYAEIAQKLGESIDVCRTLHYTAMKELRKKLQRTSIWNELKRDQTDVS